MGKRSRKQSKNKPPRLDSDADFLKAFKKKSERSKDRAQNQQTAKNRHGVDVLDEWPDSAFYTEKKEGDDENFEALLDASLKKSSGRKKQTGKPVSLKKRLKRYPPVELELDLHGFTAIGAEVKTRSFISSCKQQGFFTVRIIVGRGRHSEQGPVLPDVVEDTVKQMKQTGQVLSFLWEKKKKSVSGAMIVYIKQFDQHD